MIKIEKIQEDTLKPEDIIIIKIPSENGMPRSNYLTYVKHTKELMKKVFPNNKVLCLVDGLDIEIFKPQENLSPDPCECDPYHTNTHHVNCNHADNHTCGPECNKELKTLKEIIFK